MSSDMALGVIALVGWLILLLAGMRRRGQPPAQLIKQAALWVLIIGLLWAAAVFALHLG